MNVRIDPLGLARHLDGRLVQESPQPMELPADSDHWCGAQPDSPLRVSACDGPAVGSHIRPGRGHSTVEGGAPTIHTPLPAGEAVRRCEAFVDEHLDVVLPGTLVRVDDVGILLRGPSGSGKSDTALCLLDRGHALVADDAVRIRGRPWRGPVGSSPRLLAGRIAVRGLGVLDARQHYGPTALTDTVPVGLLVDLDPAPRRENPLTGSWRRTGFLGRGLWRIALRSGRPLAALVEAAAREWRLREHGHDAAAALVEAQKRWMR